MKFGEKLKEARTVKDMTQESLARALGISLRTICAYENGETYPRRRDMYKRLADILGVDANYLLTEDEEFITAAGEKYGRTGELQARDILDQVAALFAGGGLSDDDQLAFIHEMQHIYFDSKERAKKFAPKKYRQKAADDV